MRPDIVVGHKMHYSFGLYMSQRFLYSRSYAAARAAGWSRGAKLKMALGGKTIHEVLEMTLEEAGRFHAAATPRGWADARSDLVAFEQLLYLRQPGYGTSYVAGKLELGI